MVDVDHSRLTAQVSWLGLRVSSHFMLFYVHQINRVNTDDSRASEAFSGDYDSFSVSVCLFVCPHDKTKTAKTKISKPLSSPTN